MTTRTTTFVSNDNANALVLTTLVNSALTQIISNANDNKGETKNLLLRTQIEADLSSTDGSTFVALYETPSNVCLPSLNDKGLNQIGVLSSPLSRSLFFVSSFYKTECIPKFRLFDNVRFNLA